MDAAQLSRRTALFLAGALLFAAASAATTVSPSIVTFSPGNYQAVLTVTTDTPFTVTPPSTGNAWFTVSVSPANSSDPIPSGTTRQFTLTVNYGPNCGLGTNAP